jgi:pimeloyl-ACP methyl ester carboxylesterase
MDKMAVFLQGRDFSVLNVDYLSRSRSIEAIADSILRPIAVRLDSGPSQKIHFVTHSMGGIIVRHYLGRYPIEKLGRIVMLGPPNQGSEVADNLYDVWPVSLVLGENVGKLTTADSGFLNTLYVPDCEIGIIAGRSSINWINSLMLPGEDDGKVSVARTKLPGMKDFMVVSVAHPFLMTDEKVMAAVARFLKEGNF